MNKTLCLGTRCCVGAAIVVLAFSVPALAQRSPGSEGLATFSTEAAATARSTVAPVYTLLAKRVDEVDWDEITFEEVIDWLRDESEDRVSVVPRWNALEVQDVNRDRLITLSLGRATIGDILTETLDQLSETGEVTFRGQGNILRISTREDFNRKLELRVYDVTDILFRFPDFARSAPEIDLQQQTGGAQAQQSSQPVFRGSGGQGGEELSERGENDPQEILDELVELIRDMVAPESWSEGAQGAGRGVIRPLNRRQIVVLNTIDVHEMIAGYFALDQ